MNQKMKVGPGTGFRPSGAARRFSLALGGLAALAAFSAPSQAASCTREISVDVVAIDMPIVHNRLGASNVNGMMYALKRDVLNLDGPGLPRLRDDKRPRPLVLRVAAGDCLTINFENRLAPVANPRNAPLDLDGIGNDPNPATANGDPQIPVFVDEQVAERRVGFHASGMQLMNGIQSDGSFVGRNPSSLVAPGGGITYKVFAEHEGVFQIVNPGALVGSDANQGNTANGLFGQIIVEPAGAAMYRNTVTEEELRLAAMDLDPASPSCGTVRTTGAGQPKLDYEARYPTANCANGTDLGAAVWAAEGKAGIPILNLMDGTTIVHTEIDAVVAYGGVAGRVIGDGRFPPSTYPLERRGKRNPAYHNRLEPFRDFAQLWHDEVANAQAFPGFYNTGFVAPEAGGVDPLTNVFAYLLKGVRDKFMINYASGGIGTEILANRLGVGPMHDCVSCAYEEFFLTHFTVGEVGQLVDIPANAGLETITPQNVINILLFLKNGAPALSPAEQQFVAALGPKATRALYPADPANINHSYTGDFVKFRNTHNGFEQHIFHLHNHQWLFNPNDDNSNYLDAQGIGPGVGYTYELVNGGSGNRNKSSGDAIFHCHFYPHFAQGMWYMWRIHDVYETGTVLQVTPNAGGAPTGFHATPFALEDGTPANDGALLPTTLARALPDGEIAVGTPIPAVVPLPGKPLPPMPSTKVVVKAFDRNGDGKADSSQALVDRTGMSFDGNWNPGYPFWIAGIACETSDGSACEQGIVGQRPPTPPLDMATRAQAQELVATTAPFNAMSDPMKAHFVNIAGNYEQMHGGLPRHSLHGVSSGSAAGPTIAGIVSPVDLTKFVVKAKPAFFPEGGTDLERVAMAVHAKREHPTRTNDDAAASFVLNGLPPVPGAPFSDPCVDDVGAPAGGTNTWFGGKSLDDLVTFQSGPYGAYNPRIYRGTNMQYDAVLNKVGYHYPQQRIVALWEDVLPVITKNKPGEPLVMRLNTTDCAMYHHSNLVPETFEMDDYQVRTPTDIIGQHIHLPKWDLTTTDGAGNGWNYEDGTLAPGAVRERIHAVNKFNAERVCAGRSEILPTETAGVSITPHDHTCADGTVVSVRELVEQPHPFFGASGPGGVDWRGARITLQRWFADPLLNTLDQDRGLGIIFTHDHYGPSTFQQIGLYSTVLIEPIRSNWAHNETGAQLGCREGANNQTPPAAGATVNNAACRYDGGPTSWQAIIDTTPSGVNGDIDGDGQNDSFREFFFQYTDFQHAYEAGVYVGAGTLGEHNGQFDEKAYLGFAPALQDLFYPELHTGPAHGKFPAFAPDADRSDTFRFAIAPPLIKPVAPIFPDLTVEKAVTLADGALGAGLVPECIQRPCPTSIDFLEPGMFVVNYRNEPVALRIFDPNKIGPDGKRGAQANGLAGDLAYALQSRTDRAIAELNRMPAQGEVANPPADAAILPAANLADTKFPPHINVAGFGPGDPFTPMLRAYDGDRVRIKAQAGGDEEEHSVSVHGLKWLQSGSGHGRAPNSGWKNTHSGGISEQFTMNMPVRSDPGQIGNVADYLYMMDAHQDGFWTGDWGILRSYNARRNDLAALPNNPRAQVLANPQDFRGNVCPANAPVRSFDVTAVLANDVLPAVPGVTITPTGEQVLAAGGTPAAGPVDIATLHAGGPLPGAGTLVYNSRTTPVTGTAQGITVNETGPLHDPTAIMYVLTDDLQPLAGPDIPARRRAPGVPVRLRDGAPVEPLVLRFNAGDCVEVTLRNRLPRDRLAPDLPNYNDMRHANKRERLHPEGSTVFGVNHVRASSNVGFHLQLVEFDVTRSDGANVGANPVQTVAPGGQSTYRYYAGDLSVGGVVQVGRGNAPDRVRVVATPVEFGGSNILPADRVKQPQKGLYGQAIVEPKGATVTFPFPGTRATADVTNVPAQQLGAFTLVTPDYRDFASVQSKMSNTRYASGNAVQNESEEGPGIPENPPHTVMGTHNYRTEPTFFRFGIPPLSAAGGAHCSPPITAPKAANPADATCFGSVVNQGDLFSNVLTGGADPQTPIWVAKAGTPVRIHTTVPNSSNRAVTQQIHGHLWARDPYLAQNLDADGFPVQAPGAPLGGVGSVRIGDNPMQFYLGAQESLMGGHHWTFVLPSAGGAFGIPGDYLIRDAAAAGLGAGMWNILRVE
jgi:hypothetical protein